MWSTYLGCEDVWTRPPKVIKKQIGLRLVCHTCGKNESSSPAQDSQPPQVCPCRRYDSPSDQTYVKIGVRSASLWAISLSHQPEIALKRMTYVVILSTLMEAHAVSRAKDKLAIKLPQVPGVQHSAHGSASSDLSDSKPKPGVPPLQEHTVGCTRYRNCRWHDAHSDHH